jgi:hypothetical protein
VEPSGEVLVAFVVVGRPVSLQARRRDRVRDWMTAVRAASLGAMPAGVAMSTDRCPSDHVLPRQGDLDIDNIAKPVLDALKGA